MKSNGDVALRVLGLILGLAAATSLVLSSRIPPGTGTLGADVILASAPTGELGVSPIGPFLSATNLSPSDHDVPAGDLQVTNQTGVALDVQVRGVPSTADMDALLHVRIVAGDAPVFDGIAAPKRPTGVHDMMRNFWAAALGLAVAGAPFLAATCRRNAETRRHADLHDPGRRAAELRRAPRDAPSRRCIRPRRSTAC